jgi:hypothetical protein
VPPVPGAREAAPGASGLEVDWNVKSMPGDALVPPLSASSRCSRTRSTTDRASSERGCVSINTSCRVPRCTRS